jgi:hypothetical protein
MSCLSSDPSRSAFDLPFEAATDRIAAFHDERHRARTVDSPDGSAARVHVGPVLRVRLRLGRGLIALGSAMIPGPTRTGSRSGRRSAVSR